MEEFRFWINDELKIVSFHQVEGYELVTFLTWEFYTQRILELGGQGYRFQ